MKTITGISLRAVITTGAVGVLLIGASLEAIQGLYGWYVQDEQERKAEVAHYETVERTRSEQQGKLKELKINDSMSKIAAANKQK